MENLTRENRLRQYREEQLIKLYDKLPAERKDVTSIELDNLIEEINRIQELIQGEGLKNKINTINAREKKKRTFLEKVLKVGVIDPELITNDNRLNKTKSKQNPELYTLTEESKYIYFEHYYGEIKINHERESYRSVHFDHSTKEFREFNSFEEACNYNNVQISPLKLADVKKRIKKAEAISEKLKEQIKKAESDLELLDVYTLESEAILSRHKERAYTYILNRI